MRESNPVGEAVALENLKEDIAIQLILSQAGNVAKFGKSAISAAFANEGKVAVRGILANEGELVAERLGAKLAPKNLEGMAIYNRSQSFERHVSELVNEWRADPILESYVRKRMQELGVRPSQIGIIDEAETGGAFSMEHFMGGRNSRPAWNDTVTKGGINVDPGVFNPEFLADKAPSWATASLRDRIDAVIIHELMEYNSRAATTGLRHRSAILRSPLTEADISPGARKILEEYRAWQLRQGK